MTYNDMLRIAMEQSAEDLGCKERQGAFLLLRMVQYPFRSKCYPFRFRSILGRVYDKAFRYR